LGLRTPAQKGQDPLYCGFQSSYRPDSFNGIYQNRRF
jgi:hypothetical protein